jgi:hypothetical protein
MGWQLSGRVAAGVQDAVRQMEQDALSKQRLEAEMLGDALDRELRQKDRAERVEQNKWQRKRQEQADKTNLAGAHLEVLDSMHDAGARSAPAELSPEVLELLSGTPYEARIDRKETLPARATTTEIAPFNGNALAETGPDTAALMRGESVSPERRLYSTLSPTGAQTQQRRQLGATLQRQADLDRLANDPATPAKLKTLLSLTRAGVDTAPVGPQMLETPEDRKAQTDEGFSDFQRRERFQDSLIRGRESARDTTNRPMSAKEQREARFEAIRAARADARAEYNSLVSNLDPPKPELLQQLIEQYEDEYLGMLDAVEDVGDTGGQREDVAAPSGPASFAPQLQGAPSKRTLNLRLRRAPPQGQPPRPSGGTIRFDAEGNRVR